MYKSSTSFQAGSFQSFSPWALYCLLDPRWEQAQSQTQSQTQSLFKPVFLHFVGSLAGFGPLGTFVSCSTAPGANWRFTATLPMHQKKQQQWPKPTYQLSSEHRLLSALELAAAFYLADQQP